jgi:multidrug efflux pump subunit AcrA (membrane-fusion protein)
MRVLTALVLFAFFQVCLTQEPTPSPAPKRSASDSTAEEHKKLDDAIKSIDKKGQNFNLRFAKPDKATLDALKKKREETQEALRQAELARLLDTENFLRDAKYKLSEISDDGKSFDVILDLSKINPDTSLSNVAFELLELDSDGNTLTKKTVNLTDKNIPRLPGGKVYIRTFELDAPVVKGKIRLQGGPIQAIVNRAIYVYQEPSVPNHSPGF